MTGPSGAFLVRNAVDSDIEAIVAFEKIGRAHV